MRDLRENFRAETMYKTFFCSLLVFGLAYGLYKGVLDNYLAEVVAMNGFDRGVTEFFRELPGLALVFISAVLYTFSAEKIYKAGAVIMLAGMVMQAVVPAHQALVILCIFIFSLGDHMQQGMRSTLSLLYAKDGHGGMAMGLQTAVYQAGTLAGYIIVIVIFMFAASSLFMFKAVFWASAAVIALGFLGVWKLTAHNTGNPKAVQGRDMSGKAGIVSKILSRFYFRRKYKKYYLLETFYGARKQIFFTFGPYLLILFYGADTMIISLLFAISAICCFVLSPTVGRIIDRVGYRVVMIADTLILVIVCFFYGFAHHLFSMDIAFIICCINYILDSVISLASMASSVYVQDLSDSKEEVKATISTGVSVNHLITILIALFGGWIWQTLGIEVLFMLSALLGLCNSAYAATINPEKDRLL